MQLDRQGDAGVDQKNQLPQVLVCQLSVDTTEEHLRNAFERCQAPLAHVYLSRVPLQDPEDEERQESWCLGYAFCTLKRNSDLEKALKVLQVGSSPSVRIAQLDRQAIVSPFPGARVPSKHNSSSSSNASPADPPSNSTALPPSHAKGSTEVNRHKHPHQAEQQQQQQQQSNGPSSASLCPPLQSQRQHQSGGPEVKVSGKQGGEECEDTEEGELRAGKVARKEVTHTQSGSTPAAATTATTATAAAAAGNGVAAANLSSNGAGCNGAADGKAAERVNTGCGGAQQQSAGQGAQSAQQQQQQQPQKALQAKQQSMLPALMGSDPLTQLRQICAERGFRLKLREAPVPHNFDPQTDLRVSVEDAASVAAAAARAAEVAREMMLLQEEIDNEEGCIGDKALEGGFNSGTNQGDPRSQDEDIANRQVLAASQWVCVEGSVMDLSGYKVLALASAITPQKDKARKQAAFCMLRDILQQHPEFLPTGSTAPLPSRHKKQQGQGSKSGPPSNQPAQAKPPASSDLPPTPGKIRSTKSHQSQPPLHPQQGLATVYLGHPRQVFGHGQHLPAPPFNGSPDRPHPHSTEKAPGQQKRPPPHPGSVPYGGAVHPTPNSLMLTDMSGSGIPLEVVHLLDSVHKDGGCPSSAELVNSFCIREKARAVFVEAPTLPGMQGFFGCDASMQNNPANPGERPEVLFGPATGYGRNKQMAKQAAAAMLLNMMLLDGTDPSAFRRSKKGRTRG